ncbi:O-antigen ligase family protein [Actinomycetospora sp. CA-084318]|uniref:O-antigen ligase family protein n=1 Tax=Actinomycetospora sp. CA-084318 TaxID=3239892 RepID=UPI003D98DC55
MHIILTATIVGAFIAPSLAFAVAKGEEISRLGSIIPQISANPLAYVALAGLLSIAIRIGPDFVSKRPWLQVVLAFAYVAVLLLTRTRIGVALAVLVILLAVVFGLRHRPLPSVLFLLASVPFALLILSYTSSVTEYFLRGQDDQSLETLTGRTVIWRVAFQSVSDNPIAGLGYYSGHRLGLTALPSAQLQSNLDNTWLELLVDVGIIGTLPVAIFAIIAVARSVQNAGSPESYRPFAALLVIFGVLTSFVNPTLQAPSMTLVLLLVSTLCLRDTLPASTSRLSSGGEV